MKRNVGGIDRTARGVVGLCLLTVGIAAILDGRRTLAVVAGGGGAGLVFNWTTGFCGGNAVLGIDTTDGCAVGRRGGAE